MVRGKLSELLHICCWLIKVVIVLGLVSVAVWLSMKPRNPGFAITNVHVPDMGNNNSSTVHGNGTVDNSSLVVLVEISNPNNGMAVCYGNITMGLHYGNGLDRPKSVGEGFCQGHKKTVSREVVFDVDGQLLRGIMGGRETQVAVQTMLKYRIFNWKTKIYRMEFEGLLRISDKGNTSTNINLHRTS